LRLIRINAGELFMILQSARRLFIQGPAHRPRSIARLGVYAVAVLAFTGANAAQQLTVTGANAFRDSVYNLPLNSNGVISGTQPLNTDGGNHGTFDALVWAPNSVSGTLDLIVADATKGQIVRYSGPQYGISNVVFTYTGKGSGPAHPVGLSVDTSGNVFVISPSNPFDAPSLWVLPFNATTGIYGAPVLIDHTFSGVRTLALAEVLVAGTAATAQGGAAPAWNAGDVLVLVGDTFNSRVIVYSQAAVNGVLANPAQPLNGPTSTAISQSQFLRLLAVPFGMDLWPADATHGVGVLITTIDGRILRFDSAQGAFSSNFAGGLGLGLQKLKVGTNANTPYAFVAQVSLPTAGAILQFGAPPPSGSNPPLAAIKSGVSDPVGLAVTSADSTPITGCIAPNTCSTLGGAMTLQISGTGTSNIPQGANILAQSCIVPSDPRVSISAGGTWSCLGPQMNVCSGNQTTNCVSSTLDVANFCPGFPSTVLPASLCGHSGASGAGFEVVKATAIALDQNANDTFIQTTVDADVALPGPFNLTCAQVPIFAWAPRSDLPAVEGIIPEDLALPNTFIDLSGYCDKPGGNTKMGSMYAFGLALNSAASGLGGGPTDGLFGFVTAKFTNLTAAISAAGAQIDPTVAANVQGYINQSQAYFNSSFQNDVPNGYSCALNSLASADGYLRAHVAGFNFAQPPAGNPNPAGDFDGRLANLFLTINAYFFMQPPNTTWPTTNVPPCVTLTATPTTVPAGSGSTLTWGAATPAFPLAFPPVQCSLSASDGTFATPTTVAGSGTAVSTGALTILGAYTAALECTGAQGNTAAGLATTSVTVTPPAVLVSIAVTPNAVSIGDLFNQQFHATGIFSSGPTQDLTNSANWASSNTGIASIDQAGMAFCANTGTATITATKGVKQGSATLTCLKVIDQLGLFVSGGMTTINVGGSVTIDARAVYTQGLPASVNSTATWVSSDPHIATVVGGTVTGISPGQVNITASIVDPISGPFSATICIKVAKSSHYGH
jgi:Bacterial Ig-like domain (group 2)